MTDIERIKAILDELHSSLDELEKSLVNLLQPGEDRSRSLAPLEGRPPPQTDPNLPKVILPTPTDDPDSIVGGRPTLYKDFQDCCALGTQAGYFCSGTLIAPTLVVTAKHCKALTRVFLKGNDIRLPERGETIEVIRDIPHERTDVDLRLLVLKEPATVKPRRVARQEDLEGVNEVMLVGFGTINLDGTVGYGIKRQVKVPLAVLEGDTDTAGSFGTRGDFEMVAGHRGLGRDSCRGDSGGPLYIKAPGGSYVLLGATSRGAAGSSKVCGDGGIYVRIDRFRDWIYQATGEEI